MHQRLEPHRACGDMRRSIFAQAPWAHIRLSRTQSLAAVVGVMLIFVGTVVAPRLIGRIAIGAAVLLYVGHMGFRAVLWLAGFRPPASANLTRTDEDLPVYSIIVPMYHEANIVPGAIAALSAIDYPREKLDALFALEHDDRQTRSAFAAINLPAWCRIIVVPQAFPRTKPNACNVALAEARGEYVVVFDAEDRPEPQQLREAVATFDAGGDRVACLQARLAPYNANANFITRMFALDFCQWFDAMLTGLHRLGLPVPLGGTSNHFNRRVLQQVGGWDPYNVTEDADLGIRLWRLGWETRTINSTTWEEAPLNVGTWFNQRTRWIRGYIQTFFVHARRSSSLRLPPLGWRGWAFLILFVGASWLFALINPFFWLMMALGAAGEIELDWAFGPVIAPLAVFSTVVGNGLAGIVAFAGPIRRRWWSLMPWAIATPLYWAYVSAAAYRALITFVVDPFKWEKTPHGLVQKSRRA